jgi:hypothetical protein
MPTTVRIIHEDGICRVPIVNFTDGFVALEEDDLETLLELGLDMRWRFSNGNIWAQSGHKRVSIARLICDAGPGQQVIFVDRNPFNMLRKNMALGDGRAKYRARDRIDFSTRKRQVIVEHEVR